MKRIIQNLEERKLVGFILVAGCLLIAIFEIGLHWLMLKDNSFCKTLLSFHLYQSPNGKGESDTLDTVLPAILLGVLAGVLGKF